MTFAALWRPSPYFNNGWWTPPSGVMLHCTAATLESTLSTFTSPSSTRKVSAHYVIDPFNLKVYQCVALGNRAWHALSCNESHIGIEVVNNGPYLPVPEQGYPLIAEVVRSVVQNAVVWPAKIDPHSSCVATACPAGLDWRRVAVEATMSFDYLSIEEKVKATVRAVVLGEPHLTASALKRALTPIFTAPAPKGTKREARKGHGRGRSRDVPKGGKR